MHVFFKISLIAVTILTFTACKAVKPTEQKPTDFSSKKTKDLKAEVTDVQAKVNTDKEKAIPVIIQSTDVESNFKADFNKEVIVIGQIDEEVKLKKVEPTLTSKLRSVKNNMSVAQRQCLADYSEQYRYALCLYRDGEKELAVSTLKDIVAFEMDNQAAVVMLNKINSPLDYVTEIANNKLTKWLSKDLEIPTFKLEPPLEPVFVKPETLVKSEFETTEEFEARIADKRKEMKRKNDILRATYQNRLDFYQDSLSNYELSIKNAEEDRQDQSKDTYDNYVNTTAFEVLGQLTLVYLGYNADEAEFFALVKSPKTNLTKNVAIKMQAKDAKLLKDNIGQALVSIDFNIQLDELSISVINIELFGEKYQTRIVYKVPNFVTHSKKVTAPEF
jgi:galactitol-specific phosphotransferase system IIB component